MKNKVLVFCGLKIVEIIGLFFIFYLSYNLPLWFGIQKEFSFEMLVPHMIVGFVLLFVIIGAPIAAILLVTLGVQENWKLAKRYTETGSFRKKKQLHINDYEI